MKIRRAFAFCVVAALGVAPCTAGAARLRLPPELTQATARGAAVHGVRSDTASEGDVGSANTVTADAPVPRPREAPCVDKLFVDARFAQYAGVPFAYAPPAACPGPYAKIVFNGYFAVSAGNQFDRTASIQLGNVPLYFGTTAEPNATLGPTWHVERDVTDDAALLATAQSGEADIFNIVNSTYTGVIRGTAFLQFYPARGGFTAAHTPDVVLPFPGVAGGPQHLATGSSVLTATYALPPNVESAYFDVYSQSQQTDEQYFLCVPNDVASELFLCGNTAFRETEISIDGTPAGVAPIFPWIFTGGLDPFLWAPIPGVQTLEFKPYRVDLTPFAALLANGKSHTVAISVDNADNYFQAIGTLFAFEDRGSRHVTGTLTRDTLATNPQPTVTEKLSGTSPSIDGTIEVTNARSYEIEGFVNTSHGRVATSVSSNVTFANQQTLSNESATTGTQVVRQATNAATTVVRTGPGLFELRRRIVSYPLYVSLALSLDASGTGTQVAAIDQRFIEERGEIGTAGTFGSYESNEVKPADTLDILDGQFITGNTGQSSSQTYAAFDTRGTCYTQTIRAANNLLTAVSNAPCDRAASARTLAPLLSR